MINRLCFFCLTFLLHVISSYAQQFPDKVNAKDSSRYIYRFLSRDTLLYEAISRDSILIDKQPALLRDRTERFLLSCDSVDKKGYMHLSQRLIDITIAEYSGISQIIDRRSHEWLNKKISFIIDSTGKRHGFSSPDSIQSLLSPGSAFQPIMLQFLGEGYHLINSGWIVEETIDTPEFGIPAPMIKFLSSMRARAKYDTLQINCSRFESTLSGQGTYQTQTSSGQTLRTTGVIAGYSRMAISTALHVPVHFFGTNENKTTMNLNTTKGAMEQKAKHYVTTYITLKKMVSSRGIFTVTDMMESTKSKKSAKKNRKKK
ncbi:MAG: hypothetical protein FJ212_03465 [Ignavibacteria bacterium]|nr:hypothetical protein [Ignavibacteria bacterium]